MQSIPIQQISKVTPGVLAGAGQAIDINALLISQDNSTPFGAALGFANSADVGAYYGLTSPEYQFAQIYFAGPKNATRTPGQMYVVQYAEAPVAAWLRSANLASMTLTQLQAVTGTLTITTNGTPLTSSSINLSSATSFSQAAATIQSAFTS